MSTQDWSLPYVRLDLHGALEQTLQLISDARLGIANSTNARSKFSRWERDLHSIIMQIQQIEMFTRPQIEQALNISIDEELFVSLFFQPSTKNLFLEIVTHLNNLGLANHYHTQLLNLAMTCEFAKVLAFIGDAALSLATIHYVWQPDAREVGELTQRRAELVNNERLAQLCDLWGLYDRRIHFDPITETKSEIAHVKGTLVEALCGVLYLQYGLTAVERVVPYLSGLETQPPHSSVSR